MDGGFGDDVGVKTVAEIDWVDVVAFQVRVHYCEENLHKEVDCVQQHRQQIEPCFTGHCEEQESSER